MLQSLCGCWLALMVCMLSSAPGLAAEEWGNLSGRFVVSGNVPAPAIIAVGAGPCAAAGLVDPSLQVAADGGLANAFVYLRTKEVPVAPRYDESMRANVVLECVNCQYEPHVIAMRTSQRFKVTNREPFDVIVKMEPIINRQQNHILQAGKTEVWKLSIDEAIPIRVRSNSHHWLNAYVLVRDSPYAAISAADGRFAMRDLPAGRELQFQLWHERPGFLKNVGFPAGAADARGRFKLTIRPGDNDLGDIVVPVDILK